MPPLASQGTRARYLLLLPLAITSATSKETHILSRELDGGDGGGEGGFKRTSRRSLHAEVMISSSVKGEKKKDLQTVKKSREGEPIKAANK